MPPSSRPIFSLSTFLSSLPPHNFSLPKAVLLACKAALCYDIIEFVCIRGDSMTPLREKRLFLLDMDGTIYLDDRLFDGVIPFLQYIRRVGGVICSSPTIPPGAWRDISKKCAAWASRRREATTSPPWT